MLWLKCLELLLIKCEEEVVGHITLGGKRLPTLLMGINHRFSPRWFLLHS